MTQTNILSLRVARGPQRPIDGAAEAKANGHRLGATEAGLELTPQRLELVKAYANNALRHAPPTASQIAQRFAPRAEEVPPSGDAEPLCHAPPVAPFATLASGIRRLTLVLVVAALLPNLTLAAFWLRLIEPPWSRQGPAPASESHIPGAQPELPLPVLSAPVRLEAVAGEDVLLPLALDGTDGVPSGSVIVIKGLPPGGALSNGRAHGETEWSLRPDEIGDLHLVAAAGSGESMLTIELVAPNNGILADASTILSVTPGPAASIAGAAIETEPAEGIASVAPGAATTDEPVLVSEPVPLPTRRPSPNAADDGQADWVRLSAYVNLRDGPSSTARAISVVAKGAKLRIVARKRGWVQVANPATSQSGWIFAGNVEAMP